MISAQFGQKQVYGEPIAGRHKQLRRPAGCHWSGKPEADAHPEGQNYDPAGKSGELHAGQHWYETKPSDNGQINGLAPSSPSHFPSPLRSYLRSHEAVWQTQITDRKGPPALRVVLQPIKSHYFFNRQYMKS